MVDTICPHVRHLHRSIRAPMQKYAQPGGPLVESVLCRSELLDPRKVLRSDFRSSSEVGSVYDKVPRSARRSANRSAPFRRQVSPILIAFSNGFASEGRLAADTFLHINADDATRSRVERPGLVNHGECIGYGIPQRMREIIRQRGSRRFLNLALVRIRRDINLDRVDHDREITP